MLLHVFHTLRPKFGLCINWFAVNLDVVGRHIKQSIYMDVTEAFISGVNGQQEFKHWVSSIELMKPDRCVEK